MKATTPTNSETLAGPSPGLQREAQLHRIARDYVTEGLGARSFDAIPYHEEVELRAPLLPGGSAAPLQGRAALRDRWWAPLPDLIGAVRVLDTYVNQDRTAVTVEFHLDVHGSACTLRILDRFTVDAEGRIVAQENFFDPRPLTAPDTV
ncbi:MAG TPA: nuclear transport factor 2 family protein [Thermoanaerobaculia bacterium]|nr:nuclear transport factor 2 family protein [Thermoanaerobaculia bacterium]